MNDEAWRQIIDRGEGFDAPQEQYGSFARILEARQTDEAFVVAQLGLSLDGRIATATGDSRYINGRAALTHLHRLRALVDAVLVGAGTARIDDPRLSVRLCEGSSPARVVIDPNGTVGPAAQVWADDGSRCIVFGGTEGLPAHVERLEIAKGDIPIARIVQDLAELGLTRVLVEGGADTLKRFLAAQMIDSLHLLYGRIIIGCGPIGISLPPIEQLSAAPRPSGNTHVFSDGDVLVTCDF
ncbi:MAG: RibD family protein [Pseudomonadota bacterium]